MSSTEDSLVAEMLTHLRPPSLTPEQSDGSQIAEFYANKSVFVTGGTGFLGKALIEKLIRSCDNIKFIYILIREKRGKSAQERLADLIGSQYFDKIRDIHGGSNKLLEEKLYAIKGDITLPGFGVSREDMRLVSRDCSIVFNSAAAIRFSEPIDVAVRNNIYSTGQLIEFCNQLDNLEAIVHLSTAYSNCHKRDTIYEIHYEPPMRGDQIQASVEQMLEIQNSVNICQEIATTTETTTTTEAEADDSNPSSDHEQLGWLNGSVAARRVSCRLQKFYDDDVQFHRSKSSNDVGGLIASASSNSLLLNTEKPSATTTTQQQQQQLATSATSKSPDSKQRTATTSYDLLAEFTRIALRMSNRPNTYTFTKAISESYLLDRARSRPDRYLGQGKIPIAIIRPSIVGAAWREPIVGLVDNYNGPTGAILSLYTGALQAMPGNGECVADLVPVDMVVNMVACAGWYLATNHKRLESNRQPANIRTDNGMYMFNFVSGFRNPVKWGQFTELISELSYKYPSKFLVRLPGSYFIRAGRLYNLYDLLNHKLPAYLTDLVRSKLLGRPCEGRSSAMVGYQRIRQMTETLTPFTTNQWRLSDTNVRMLSECLSPRDKQLFYFDITAVNWTDYLKSYIIGSRIYAMQDQARNVPSALRTLKRRQQINGLLMSALLLLIYFLFVRNSRLESSLLSWL